MTAVFDLDLEQKRFRRNHCTCVLYVSRNLNGENMHLTQFPVNVKLLYQTTKHCSEKTALKRLSGSRLSYLK